MEKIDFNNDWLVRRLNDSGDGKRVDLPYDAMLGDPRSNQSRGGTNIGWYEGFDYEYSKEFVIPELYQEKDIVFEFEGVYHNAEIYINGQKAAYRPYGYTNFYVVANDYLKFGGSNQILVIARNADQPNSRWYTGTGIYRPVNLYVLEKKRIELNGVKIRTVSIDPAVIEVRVRTRVPGTVKVEILDGQEVVCEDVVDCQAEGLRQFSIPNAKLWSVETPNRYCCRAIFEGVVTEEVFGIRSIGCDAKQGFTLNGKRVILRGTCIHHDNGLLGACAFPEAEERKARILKENGYNAIRSAHNPCSKALLDACDAIGMLVLDEYVDMWYSHKTLFDYATHFNDWYQQDIKDMIDKDYNHPCVVMYSIGNEVSETAEEQGVAVCGALASLVRSLDDTRPITCAINIFFNIVWSIGQPIFSSKKAKQAYEAPLPAFKAKSPLTEKLDIFMAWFNEMNMKITSGIHRADIKTKDAFARVEVAGYNYGIIRYKKDMKKYPNRVILGSESYLQDTYEFWELAKDHPALIGDFVWTGWDYMGEIGLGAKEFKDYAKDFNHDKGWLTAGCGRIDITGKPRAEMGYTRAIFELEKKPLLAVVPVSGKGARSAATWGITNAVESWSWNGLDGESATVEVYARCARVKLFINNVCVGEQQPKKCRCVFKTKYQGGEITAVSLDEQGTEISRNTLRTAGDETKLQVIPEQTEQTAGRLCFVRLKFTDGSGTLKPLERGRIKVTVEGGTLVGLGHACPYNPDGYLKDETDTYYGEALAVVRAGQAGKLSVRAMCDKYAGDAEIAITP